MARSDPPIGAAAVWIDHDYDQAHAGPGSGSRYADLVCATADLFTDDWDSGTSAARVAATAWMIATEPEAGPAYVRRHRLVFNMDVDWAGDGSLIAKMELITPAPGSLAPFASGRPWRDWPSTTWDTDPRQAPSDEQILASPFLLSSSVLMFRLEADLPQIPAGPPGGDTLADVAARAVSAIAAAINEIVSPAIAALEAPDDARAFQNRS